MRAFSFQWKRSTWAERVDNYTGKPVPYSASNQFEQAGIRGDDAIYVVALSEARTDLLLIGRFLAASRDYLLDDGDPESACLDPDEARSVLSDKFYGVPLFERDWYLVPKPGSATPMSFDRLLPADTPLLFGAPGEEPRSLFRDPDGRINQQAVRSVRRLHAHTVAIFEELLATEPTPGT